MNNGVTAHVLARMCVNAWSCRVSLPHLTLQHLSSWGAHVCQSECTGVRGSAGVQAVTRGPVTARLWHEAQLHLVSCGRATQMGSAHCATPAPVAHHHRWCTGCSQYSHGSMPSCLSPVDHPAGELLWEGPPPNGGPVEGANALSSPLHPSLALLLPLPVPTRRS